jgi:hypothetical protein
MKITIAGLLLALALTGCGTPIPPPAYTDAFQGLVNQSAATVPADRPVTMRQPLGLIFSDNLELYLRYVQAGDAELKSYGPLTNTTAVADIDPKFIAANVLTMLKSHYPDIELLQDFNQAIASGKKGVCLVDIQPVLGQRSGQTTTIDIVAYFFDERMQPVSRIAGRGTAVLPYPAWDIGVQPATRAAVEQLDGKLTALAK